MRVITSRYHVASWFALILFTVWAWRTPPIAEKPNWRDLGISLIEGKVYRTIESRSLALDVYRPIDDAGASGARRLRPALLALHGGSWNGGSMTAFRYDPRNVVIRLAQQGVVVFAVDYRLARPGEPSWPSVVGDLREAVRWVRRNSGEFGVDSARIGVIGQSAGGHLAELLGTLPEERGIDGVSSRVQAVVSLYGPSDLPGLMRSRRLDHEPARVFLGDLAGGAAVRGDEASPIEHVSPDDPPALLIHGTDDDWVPLEQSVRMATALAAAGVPHRLIVVDGARHGFETLIEAPRQRDLLPEILAFLENAWNISSVAVRADSTGGFGVIPTTRASQDCLGPSRATTTITIVKGGMLADARSTHAIPP
jgi:acetyl esterase/lipase